MKRRLLIAAAVLLIPAILLGWLLGTESGLRWAYRTATPWLPGGFEAGEISGVLAGPIRLTGAVYRQRELAVDASSIELDWNPWALFGLELEVTSLRVESLRIETSDAAASAGEPGQPLALPRIELPLALHLGNTLVEDIEIRRGETALRLTRIGLQLDAQYNRFDIGELRIEADEFSLRLDGKFATREHYPHELGFDWRGTLPAGETLTGNGRIAGDFSATRLEQQVQGALALQHWFELENPLDSPRWRSGIEVVDFDSRLLRPELPAVAGSLRATAEGNLEAASANGRLEAEAPRIGKFSANFTVHSLEGERRFDGLRIGDLTVNALDGELRSQGRIEWLPVPRWNAEASASNIDPSVAFAGWPGRLSAEFDSSGSYQDGRLLARLGLAELQGRLRDYPVAAQGELQWNDGAIAVDGLEIASGDTRVQATGQAAETLDLKWRLVSDNLGEIYPRASGSLDAEGIVGGRRESPRVEGSFEGRSLGFGEYHLGLASGRVALDPLQFERFDIRLSASDLNIYGRPLQSAAIVADQRRIEARLEAAAGNARLALDGSLDDGQWRGKLVEAVIESRDYSDWQLLEPAPLELSTERIRATGICLQNPRQGRLCGSVDQHPDRWDIAIDVDRLPLSMLAQWMPPRLQADGLADAQARLAWSPAAGRLRGNARIELDAGSARFAFEPDRPLPLEYRSASLDLRLQDDALAADAALELANGDRLQAGARLPGAELLDPALASRPLEASLRGQLSELGPIDELSPRIDSLNGLLEMDLVVSGRLDAPRVGGEVRLRDASLRIARLDLPLEELDLLITGDNTQTLGYRASAALDAGRLEADGSIRLDPKAGWPSELRLVGRDIAADEYLRRWLPAEINIDGLIDADAELQFSAPRRLRGTIALASAQGLLNYPLLKNEFEHWQYRDARLAFELGDGGISGETRVTIGDDNRLRGSLNLPRASLLELDPDNQPLTASAQLEFSQIGVIEALVPDLDNPRGRLTLDAEAGGTLGQPRLTARAELADAAVDVPRLGLKIRQVRMTGNSDADGRFNFVLDAHSGDGQLRLQGSSLLDAASGWPTRIEIKGENFEAARIPEASVDLSPELLVEIEGREIDISGDLHVPFARLEPRDVSTAQRVSNDTVVIGGDQPVDPGWRISTRINLTLGERVTFFGYGFEGRLAGRLLIEQQPGQLTSGTGEVSIPSGRYRAYGQRLDIENGRVLFTGGPVTNPGLDIRATRDSNGIVTGLLVSGRLRQPQIELFSIPAMGQTDALSYLLFGRPMEDASGEDSALMAQAALTLGLAGGDQLARSLRERFGFDEFRVETADSGDQASLVVGRYLSPDFYVSYAVGLIESVNSLNLRYRITDRWQLEAESGMHHGADLLYTIER